MIASSVWQRSMLLLAAAPVERRIHQMQVIAAIIAMIATERTRSSSAVPKRVAHIGALLMVNVARTVSLAVLTFSALSSSGVRQNPLLAMLSAGVIDAKGDCENPKKAMGEGRGSAEASFF